MDWWQVWLQVGCGAAAGVLGLWLGSIHGKWRRRKLVAGLPDARRRIMFALIHTGMTGPEAAETVQEHDDEVLATRETGQLLLSALLGPATGFDVFLAQHRRQDPDAPQS